MKLVVGTYLIVVVLGIAGLWLTDRISLQDEVTVFTVHCDGGTWEGPRCTGRLAAAQRYRYRALKRRGEVLFWVPGEVSPSHKLTNCEIRDGRNWVCGPSEDALHSITLEMKRGQPLHDVSGATKPFHAISKLRWWILRMDLFTLHTVRN